MDPILIMYSSPADEERLRLDHEHKRMEEAIRALGIGAELVQRCHAATLKDLARAVGSGKFNIVHFSGHGSSSGFYFDSESSDSGEFVSAEHFARLLRTSQPSLCALVLMSCYSSDSVPILLSAAPYVISISGAADDDATIDFVGHFYETYIRTSSIERAFGFASAYVHERLNAVLHHRSETEHKKARLVVYPSGNRDPIYVDLSEAQSTIDRLDVTPERFVSILTRKLRIHRWIFEGERENVILPIGKYFARFSWKNARDVVYCHWVYKPKSGLDIFLSQVVSDLIVIYNDIYVSSYRTDPRPVAQQDPKNLKFGLEKLHDFMDHFLKNEENFSVLEAVNPDGMRMLLTTCHSNLMMADRKLVEGNPSTAAIYAETALSSIHDAIEDLVEVISD